MLICDPGVLVFFVHNLYGSVLRINYWGLLHGVRGGMDKPQHPEPLSFQGNLSENWRKWKQRFELYMTASGNNSKSDGTKSFYFTWPAQKCSRSTTTSLETKMDAKKVGKIFEKFKAYCTPHKNVMWDIHIFNGRNQLPGETIDHYVTDLRSKAESGEFGTLSESLICDPIICGVLSDDTWRRHLKQANLTLSDATNMQGRWGHCSSDEINTSDKRPRSTATPQNDEDPSHWRPTNWNETAAVWQLWRNTHDNRDVLRLAQNATNAGKRTTLPESVAQKPPESEALWTRIW